MTPQSQKIFLSYPDKRDVLFVLGAGASHPDGVPLQRHILPQIIRGDINEINNSEIGRSVIEFVNDNFAFEDKPNNHTQLEAVFGFLDYFIQQNESLNSKYTNLKIRDIKESLIKLIHYIVNLQTDSSSKYYHQLWKAVNKYNTNTSFITLNYDTLLEHAFSFLFKKYGYIDYCIPLMNYEKSEKLKAFNYWTNPREPIEVAEDENPIPYKIIKLHGSLNWKYCNCCGQTLLTPWDRTIDLKRGKFLGYTYPEKQEYEYFCPIDGTEFQTLIMPPSSVKFLTHPVINQLFSEASREIRSTKKIIFVGYSLSSSDVHIKALFKKQLKENIKIIVINQKNSLRLMNKYLALSKDIEFIDCRFEDMVTDEALMEKLLS
jgi:NAD-dependent SIR2 family protein deacetylase